MTSKLPIHRNHRSRGVGITGYADLSLLSPFTYTAHSVSHVDCWGAADYNLSSRQPKAAAAVQSSEPPTIELSLLECREPPLFQRLK